ncbi:uncharacterized protein LOC111922175 isoform X3 [Cyanistes caeruleus]|uniref:uncharacterized protein LOC111922175 isoform X3 n=1 Tax=Cyanistes caeruleus TaxID=156563 RepID=UPI000CDA5676|nr:uncharacterized protein LOC111922175 isoform X3 [Cyanistes caeruleus]XP_023773494.1 uncharacterized protein LOC111922175 isoform X3 [Cyanistes caeruleus]
MSWMLLCLRELHHNMQWKIISVIPSSLGNTHRRLSSSGTSIMLRHITLPRPEWMAWEMKPLRNCCTPELLGVAPLVTQESTGGSCPDYSTCLQVVPPLLSGAQGSQQGLQPPPANPLKQVAPKRSSSYLMSSPEPGPVEFPAPGGAARYSESSLKKKRVY